MTISKVSAAISPPGAKEPAMPDSDNPPPDRIVFDTAEDFLAACPKGRLIGIDPGTKTLGLALTDVERRIASALTTLRRRKFSLDVQDLIALAKEHAVAGWIVGLPTNLDGSAGPRVQATRAFAQNLATALGLPVLLWDERLSTVSAERMLIDAGASRKRRGEVIDKVAAAIILQAALDRLRDC